MEIYPEIPGRAELVLGSPVFTRMKVHRSAGDIEIAAKGAGPGKPYVHGLLVNGKHLQTWLPESFSLKAVRSPSI